MQALQGTTSLMYVYHNFVLANFMHCFFLGSCKLTIFAIVFTDKVEKFYPIVQHEEHSDS